MQEIIIAILIVVILCAVIMYLRSVGLSTKLDRQKNSCHDELSRLRTRNTQLEKDIQTALDVKYADENIFAYLKCLNSPRTQVCNDTPDGGRVCRSRLMDCSRFKGIVFNDPVASARIVQAINT
jgi:hypothetical protein